MSEFTTSGTPLPVRGQWDAIERFRAIAKRYWQLEDASKDECARAHFREIALDYEQQADRVQEAMQSWLQQL